MSVKWCQRCGDRPAVGAFCLGCIPTKTEAAKTMKDLIKNNSTNFIVGVASVGLIFFEADTLIQAQGQKYTTLCMVPNLNLRLAIYTREEWETL